MIHPRMSLSNIILDQDQEFLFLWRKRMDVSVGSRYSDTNYYKGVEDTKFDNEAEWSKDASTLNVQRWVKPPSLALRSRRSAKVLRYHYLLAIITYVQTVPAKQCIGFFTRSGRSLFQMNRARNGLLQSSINYIYLIHVGWWPRKCLAQPAQLVQSLTPQVVAALQYFAPQP